MLDPTKSLTSEQLSFFENEGYLIVPNVFDPADLEPLRAELDQLIDTEARRLQSVGELADIHEGIDFDRRLVAIHHDSPETAQKILQYLGDFETGGMNAPEMFNAIVNPKLLGAVSSILDSKEIVASSVYRIRSKLPEISQGDVPWHQDSGYYAEHCDEKLIVTCWVPLVNATVENGCMQILPKTHRGQVALHHTGGNSGFLVINDEDLPADPQCAVAAECPVGGVVFMTNRTPHCSTPNTSDHVRWSVDLRYQSAEVPNNVGVLPETMAEDGEADERFYEQVTVACYPPDADFYVNSEQQPDLVEGYQDYHTRRLAYAKTKKRFFSRERWPARATAEA